MKKKKEVILTTPEFSLIDENFLKSRIYTIRGVKVMLDADLAEIYGYETRFFNRQVKNNIERFAEDFRFQLTAEEMQILMCKNCTSSWGGTRKLPYAFTEQGVYMLMSVLKGDLAIQQSTALIRLFKKMKDYIVDENRLLLESDGIAQVAAHTIQNTKEIADIRQDISVMKTGLQKVMQNFTDSSTFKHFLILNGQRLEADVAYTQIYSMAKKSVLIVDDYLDVKTLDLLRCVAMGVSVQFFSEQHGRTHLTESMLADFKTARPDVKLGDVCATGNMFHDRYIYLDFGTTSEKLFHCGASSKDAGNKVTTIMQIECSEMYHPIMEKLMNRQQDKPAQRRA